MTKSFASGTAVPVEKTQAEIIKMLTAFGIKKHALISSDSPVLMFEYRDTSYKLTIRMPDPDSREFQKDKSGYRVSSLVATQRYEAEVRRRWRCLALVVKAKFVAVHDEIVSFEQEFLSYAVGNDGRTVAEIVIPMLEQKAFGTSFAKALGSGR